MRIYSIMAAVLASCAYAGTALAQASGISSVDATTPSTKVGGVMWLDFGYIKLQNQNANGVYTDTPPTGTGFDVKRFYVVVDGRYNDIWAANLTLDAQYSSDVGQTTVFVKKMYVEGRFDPRFVLRIGAADLPWIPFVEGQQGYRWIDRSRSTAWGSARQPIGASTPSAPSALI